MYINRTNWIDRYHDRYINRTRYIQEIKTRYVNKTRYIRRINWTDIPREYYVYREKYNITNKTAEYCPDYVWFDISIMVLYVSIGIAIGVIFQLWNDTFEE